ncbi:MAG: DUF4870 domain-containing protein [Chloroflexi bacterium]|nr:DUF4870 domain-containing protein [Chloroflexota bacterium]
MIDDPILPHDELDRVNRLSSSETEPVARPTLEESERSSRLAVQTSEQSPAGAPAPRLPRETLRSSGSWPRTPRTTVAVPVSDDERLWAAVAHASAWITLFGGIVSIGAVLPVSIFIPLVIFFIFRKKSEYIAFHALQAFVLQLVGTVGAAALLAVGGVVWGIGMVVALIAVMAVVGFVLVPLWGFVGLGLLAVVLLLPLSMVFYGTLGAIESFRGRDYRYPVISRWIDRQLHGSHYRYV